MKDMSKKNKVYLTILLCAIPLIFIGLTMASVITKSFILDCITNFYLRLMMYSLVVYIIYVCFRKTISKSMKKVLIICSVFFFLDAVMNLIRFILSSGLSIITFLPLSLSLCFITIMYYSCKDNNRSKKERNTAIAIGIVLILISLFLEICSFVDIIYGA